MVNSGIEKLSVLLSVAQHVVLHRILDWMPRATRFLNLLANFHVRVLGPIRARAECWDVVFCPSSCEASSTKGVNRLN